MKTIGMTGGSSLFELGSATEVQLFFDCLDVYVVGRRPTQDWLVLTDRLYKRYVRQHEMDTAEQQMESARAALGSVSAQVLGQGVFLDSAARTRLDPNGSTLAAVFRVYFDSFAHCAESAKLNHETFKDHAGYQYEPVRLVRADLPWFLVEKRRSMPEYDELEGKPYWSVD